jgi:hypothetical protein
MKNILFFLVFIITSNAFAQEINMYEKIKTAQEEGKIIVDPHFLEGVWTNKDDTTCGIIFTLKNNQLSLTRDQKIVFRFNRLNKLKTKTFLGTFVNWPPQYCIVSIMPNNILQVEFLDLTANTSQKNYYIKN